MKNQIYLKDGVHEKLQTEKICNWDYQSIVSTNCRIYYRPYDGGFYFYIVEKVAVDKGVQKVKNNVWNPDATIVECLFLGDATMKGIKRIQIEASVIDCEYPDIKMHILVMKALYNLQFKHCFLWQNHYCSL